MLRPGRRATYALLTAVGLSGVLVPSPASASTHALIQGSGSASAANIVNQWVATVAEQGMQVVYTANGSTQGRQDFSYRSSDFGVSDLPYEGGDDDTSRGRDYAYVPLLGEGLAFSYHLEVDGHLVRNLRLSGQTIAGIFTGAITSWADPAIASDNNGRILPDTPIQPLVRSDASGTTEVLTDYLNQLFPGTWAACNGGLAEPTAYFPLHCGRPTGTDVAIAGADGMMNRIKSSGSNGAIGYIDTMYPLFTDYPVAAVENTAGYYAPPTGYNVGVALTKARLDDDHAPVLDDVYRSTDPRAYPLSHYEYAIVPTAADDSRMTTHKRQTLVDFLSYAVCTGQSTSRVLGYAALPPGLVDEALSQTATIAAGDTFVDLSALDPSSCATDDIEEIAPQPQACQQSGAGPCGTGGPPTNLVAPRVAGAARVGATVEADSGLWTGEEAMAYQWLADGQPITGATGGTYQVPAALLGRSLSFRVTVSASDFPSSTVQSAAKVVARGHLHGSRLRIAGRPIVGRTLAVRDAGIPGAQLHAQWYAADHRIPGATALRWTLRRAQQGKRISVRVTATRAGYESLVRTSARTSAVRRR
ncbi:substrate-binding domain-containing protein [Nocardioides conyzicola]|uniref:Phosphate ABC transporter substrate-binding protein PstS n=1 Tax=Nocardioides conyzicola TaxID=1651781 RepID=A0ABP8X2C1_9ACTN